MLYKLSADFMKGSEVVTVKTTFKARSTNFSDNVQRKAELICGVIIKELGFLDFHTLEITKATAEDLIHIPNSTFQNSKRHNIKYKKL